MICGRAHLIPINILYNNFHNMQIEKFFEEYVFNFCLYSWLAGFRRIQTDAKIFIRFYFFYFCED